MEKYDKISIKIGIYTCFGGPSLVNAVKSIRMADEGANIEIVIFADGRPISGEVKSELENLKVRIIEKQGLRSVITKIRNLVSLMESDIIMLTQDDVLFDKKAIVEVRKSFQQDSGVTMIGSSIRPMPAETRIESILAIGSDLVRRIGARWNSGDNYLLSNGRCLSFRTEIIRKFSFPEKIMNTDAYLYFENKRIGGQFSFVEKSIVYIKSPLTLKEHFNQSSRFQTSAIELRNYFDSSLLSKEYKIPTGIFLKEFLRIFFSHPLRCTGYLAAVLYTRLKPRKTDRIINPSWKTDESTKRAK